MQTPPRPLPLPQTMLSLETPPEPRGIWGLLDGELVILERVASGPEIVLVPSEFVTTTAVDLPLPTRQKQILALPFAIEDMLAAPLGEVHVALGVELAPRRFLAGVVAHEQMRGWIAQLYAAGLERAALVPDALALPIPAEGSWSVDLEGARARVRAADATGFAIDVAMLPAAWAAAGRPDCTSYGDPLPAAFASIPAAVEIEPLVGRLTQPALDLRQGMYARPRSAVPLLWKRIAIIAAAGALAHGAIAAGDTIALSHIASVHETRARAAIAAAAPNLVVGADLAESAADLLPNGSGATPGTFLPILVRTSGALRRMPGGASLKALRFDAAAATLTIDVEAADIATLQKVGAALSAAGLTAETGASSVDQGKASGVFVVRVA